MLRSLAVLACLLAVVVAPQAFAQGKGGGAASVTTSSGSVSNGVLVGGHLFFYADQSNLGDDELKDGGATLMRLDMQYNNLDYFIGGGLFYEMDGYGEDQKDTVMGALIEPNLGSFYVKIMYGFIEQNFERRSFTKRSGTFFAIEPGLRANLLAGVFFYEIALHRRTQTITQEDGRDMEAQFVKTELMPMLGMGVSL